MISLNTNYGGLFASKAASQAQRGLDTAMVVTQEGDEFMVFPDNLEDVLNRLEKARQRIY